MSLDGSLRCKDFETDATTTTATITTTTTTSVTGNIICDSCSSTGPTTETVEGNYKKGHNFVENNLLYFK